MLKSIVVSIAIAICILHIGITMPSKFSNEIPLKVQLSNLTKEAKRQVECLTDNIFFESAYEPDQGKIAVAFVTINRVNSGIFAKDICGVVKQKVQDVCQFSWYCIEKTNRLSHTKDLTFEQEKVYNDITKIALDVYLNYEKMYDPTNGALFYHADYVNPGWKNMVRTATIGRHIFYIRKDSI